MKRGGGHFFVMMQNPVVDVPRGCVVNAEHVVLSLQSAGNIDAEHVALSL